MSDGTPVDPSLFEGGFPENGFKGQPQSVLQLNGGDSVPSHTKTMLYIGHLIYSGSEPACVKIGSND